MVSQDPLIVKLSLPSGRAAADSCQAVLLPVPATTSAPTKMSSYFTQSQLALALTIQKAKPRGLSTSGMPLLSSSQLKVNSAIEFCRQLRSHIKTGHSVADDQLRYVDTSDFWKDQYTSILLRNEALVNKLEYFEQAQQLSHDQPTVDERINQMYEADKFGTIEPGNSRKRHVITQNIELYQDPDDDVTSPSIWDKRTLRLSSYGMKETSGNDS
jgi:hypothetical protein